MGTCSISMILLRRKEKLMLKLKLSWVVLVVVLVGICSCGGDSISGVTSVDTSDSASEAVYLHQYSVNEDGTIVTEIDTGVMWQQSGGWQTMTWDEAVEYCEQLTLGEYENWQLPEEDLLMMLFERDAYEWHSMDDPPYINNVFDCRLGKYWSSTSSSNDNYAHTVTYEDNPNNWQLHIWDSEDKTDYYYVRCACLDNV